MNCVFVDEKLKYQTLTLNEEIYSAERIIKPNSLVVPKGIKVEKKSEVIETLPEMNEKIPRSENRLDLKKQEEYSTLLHKELCYESNGRK